MEYISLIVGVASLVPAFITLFIMNKKSKKSRDDIEKSIENIKVDNLDLNAALLGEKNISEDIGRATSENVVKGLLKNYHNQALMQASVQYWFSLFASVVGFVFIIIMMLLNTRDMEWFDYVVKVLPGVIIEAVSVLFFQQSKEIRERATDFFNQLRDDDKINKSVSIANSITDEKLQSEVKTKIALHISGITMTSDNK